MKRKRAVWLLAFACMLATCSCKEHRSSTEEHPLGAGHGGDGSGAGGSGASEAGGGAGTNSGNGGRGGAGAGAGATSGSGQSDAGAELDDAGDELPTVDAGAIDAGVIGVIEPRIPTPIGSCPDLSTGKQTILGLSTDIIACEPGATPGPLLFVWHGTADTASSALARLPASIRDDITANGGLIVAPNDTLTTRAGRDIAVSLDVWFDSDFDFADQIVACAVRDHNIDPRRIYATGCGAGGLMAGTMTLARSSYVAGTMFQSGGITSADWSLDEPLHAPLAIAMLGQQLDFTLDYGPLSRMLGDQLTEAGGYLVSCDYGGAQCGAPVELQEQAWQLLKQYPFGVALSPLASGLPMDYPEYCKVRD